MFPIRCTTCNKVLGDLVDSYEKKISEGKSPLECFIELKLRRYCCRSDFLGYSHYLNQEISTQIVGSKSIVILK